MKVYHLAFLLLFPFAFPLNEAVELLASSPITDSEPKLNTNKKAVTNIVFKSSDGGQTWQDMSEGLPENWKTGSFFANERGLYLRDGNELYHSKANATTPFWEKESFPDGLSNMAPSKTGIVAYNYREGQFLQKINETSLWLPMYTNLQEKKVSTIFETARGSVFIGSDKGLFKSINGGKTWRQVHTGGWVMKVVESNGVLLATSQKGIVRSSDEGENWDLVISEGGVGIAVETIKGGFAAITYNTASKTRRVRTSYDGGKSWQPIDATLPASLNIASIIEVGDYLFCGHPNGIFRSADKGKTWKLIFASIENKFFNFNVSVPNKVFNLSVSGKVIYAIPKEGGC
jgi:photosystem II stability/assembly factor-like uncharacterized protein